MLTLSPEISISVQQIKKIVHDAKKTATAVNLVYVHDHEPGFSRIRRGRGFVYKAGSKNINDATTLMRIKKLVIPPAWKNVWICMQENGHLQATGIDAKRRKQYKYHALWNSLRNQTKFYRLYAFGCRLSAIRARIEKDLSRPGLPPEKVLAAVVSLMEQTSIRIGNSVYEKLYGSFGLTTLKDKHVKIKGSKLQFVFTGKKGVAHRITLKSRRLAVIVQKCRDIPGKELCQYYDEAGNRGSIDSGKVNQYLKSICGTDFSAKDFRTWAGTLHALNAFRETGPGKNINHTKKNIVAAFDCAARHLGNTRTVCKKYYVHPAVVDLYEKNKLGKYLSANNFSAFEESRLSHDEKLLMNLLLKEGLTI